MAYTIQIEKQALKFLDKAPKKDSLKLIEHIDALANNPHPPGSIKLKDSENEYRIRYGDYRILYSIENNILTVFVTNVGNRKDVYKRSA